MSARIRGGASSQAPTWQTTREAAQMVCRHQHLWRTCLTALIVGTVLFAINHLDTVLAGKATAETWIKVGLTYLVPFIVANIGLLLGSHRPPTATPRR